MAQPKPTILFAGGGTGGHIYPSLAVAEQVRGAAPGFQAHFICSDRPIDASILRDAGAAFTPSPVRPLPPPRKPWRALPFLLAYRSAKRHAVRLLRELDARAVVAMGGFVSGPVASAARSLRIPTLLVNLDAMPGKANRFLARRCQKILTVYDTHGTLPDAARVAFPLRKACLADSAPDRCRDALGLDPNRPVLLITGASQGAQSINELMLELTTLASFRSAMTGWSILHLAGDTRSGKLERAYTRAQIPARVLDYCHTMGQAWGAAALAISRAGAGSVWEAAANGVPAIFLPYPYHKDGHQRLNALPFVEAGGAILVEDRIDPSRNANELEPLLHPLLTSPERLRTMRESLRMAHPGHGSRAVAQAVLELASHADPVLQSPP